MCWDVKFLIFNPSDRNYNDFLLAMNLTAIISEILKHYPFVVLFYLFAFLINTA